MKNLMRFGAQMFFVIATCSAATADPFENAGAEFKNEDYKSAARDFFALASQGDARSEAMLGIMYAYGLGVIQNLEEAVHWEELAANQGNPGAEDMLGDFYTNGTGVPQNYSEAIRFYHSAAAQNDSDAQNSLGDIYRYGIGGVQQNDPEAVKWYRLAAQQGNQKAQFSIGFMYSLGAGVGRDYSEALKWLLLAAKNRSGPAEAQIGLLYDKGYGVPQNYTEAVRWYRLSAQDANSMGAAFLGESYSTGHGVSVDLSRAYMWLNLAASGLTGDLQQTAIRERDEIAAKLSTSEIDAAQRMGNACEGTEYKKCGIDMVTANASVSSKRRQNNLNWTNSENARQEASETPQLFATGSGFFVNNQGFIITNAHVIEGCVAVRTSKGEKLEQVAIDKESDLALLKSKTVNESFARLHGEKGARLGEAVVAVGFPLHGVLGTNAIVTTGIISSLAGLDNDRRNIQVSAPVQPGNSGGPVLGENGSVVGVVVGKLDAIRVASAIGDIPQNVNFAVGLGTLQSFLNANSVSYVLNDQVVTRSPADIAAEASQYSISVECWK